MQGFGHSQIAVEMGMAPESVGRVVRSPLFQQKAAVRREELDKEESKVLVKTTVQAQDILNSAAQSAAEVQVELLTSPDEKVVLSSSKAILERALGPVGGVQEQKSVQVLISIEQMNVLQQAILETDDGTGKGRYASSDGRGETLAEREVNEQPVLLCERGAGIRPSLEGNSSSDLSYVGEDVDTRGADREEEESCVAQNVVEDHDLLHRLSYLAGCQEPKYQDSAVSEYLQ